jgi:hypothetical protein
MLAWLLQGWRLPGRDPRNCHESDPIEAATKAGEFIDHPASGRGMLPASDDGLIPVLLFRFQP